MKKKWTEIEKALMAVEWDYSTQMIAAYQDSLTDIRGQITKLRTKYKDLNYSQLTQYGRLQAIEKQLVNNLKGLGKDVRNITRKGMKHSFSENYLRTGWGVETYTGIDMKFAQVSEKQVEAMMKRRIEWPKSVGRNMVTTANRLKQEMVRGIIQGSGYAEMNKNITKQMDISANKSMRILRTEVHAAQVEARIDGLNTTQSAADRVGLKMDKRWWTAGDERVRLSHVEMQGQKADKEGLFTFDSGATTRGPGLSGIVEEDVNCRCTVIAEFPELEGLPEFEPGDEINNSKLYCLI